jgi:D-alanine transaminase
VSTTLATAYLNGEFLPIEQAAISPLDRGFLFGDAVYEVIPVRSAEPSLLDAHLQRLERNLNALRISNPHSQTEWRILIEELARVTEPVGPVYVDLHPDMLDRKSVV